MPARRNARGKWFYRKRVKLPDGTRVEITGTPSRNTKLAADQAERAHIDRVLNPLPVTITKEVPTFDEWFTRDFTEEWIKGRKNKPSTAEEKEGIFRVHLKPAFGELFLDQIDVGEIAKFRSRLVASKTSEKRINNILGVLSKALRYAVDRGKIDRAPSVGLFRVERPEIHFWSFEEYVRLLDAARAYKPEWYAGVCLAGEAGLRVGEVKALRWKEDVDLIAGTITVNQQVRHRHITTPKGRTRRTIPMTSTLLAALKRLEVIRNGYVICNLDGSMKTDNQAEWAITAICERAGLPVVKWHRLRHTFGTHCALFGVNPWSLMRWLGHKRMEETLLYVHTAEAHNRPIPEGVLAAARAESDPDRKIISMLSGRCITVASPTESRCNSLEG